MPEVSDKLSQQPLSYVVTGWAAIQCLAIEEDRLAHMVCPAALLKLGESGFARESISSTDTVASMASVLFRAFSCCVQRDNSFLADINVVSVLSSHR